ncbi:unnamed protein product [Prunus armeniaca]
MVVTLLIIFEAQPDQPNYMDGDVFDEVESMVQMEGVKEIEVAQEIPKERNTQPCIMVPKNGGKIAYEVLMDMGAMVNILPASIMRKLKKGSDELIPTETTVSEFVGDTTTSKRIIPLQVRVRQKVRMTAFFVIKIMTYFNALSGRDWIHGSMCVPFSLHQFLQFWHEDGSVETVEADARPFIASINAIEAKFYEDDIGPIYFTGDTNIEEENKAAVEDPLRRLYEFWAKRVAEHGSTTNLVKFLHKGPKDDALELEEVELAPSEMDDSKVEVQGPLVEINLGMEDNHRPIYVRSNGARTSGQDGRLLREFKDCFAWEYTEMP